MMTRFSKYALLAAPLLLGASPAVAQEADEGLNEALACASNQPPANLATQITDQMIESLTDPAVPAIDTQVVEKLLTACGLGYLNDQPKMVAFGFGAVGRFLLKDSNKRLSASGYDTAKAYNRLLPLIDALPDDQINPMSFAPPESMRLILDEMERAGSTQSSLERKEFTGLFVAFVSGLFMEEAMMREFAKEAS